MGVLFCIMYFGEGGGGGGGEREIVRNKFRHHKWLKQIYEYYLINVSIEFNVVQQKADHVGYFAVWPLFDYSY